MEETDFYFLFTSAWSLIHEGLEPTPWAANVGCHYPTHLLKCLDSFLWWNECVAVNLKYATDWLFVFNSPAHPVVGHFGEGLR